MMSFPEEGETWNVESRQEIGIGRSKIVGWRLNQDKGSITQVRRVKRGRVKGAFCLVSEKWEQGT